jgi:AmmeMemoRadiSam system protein A
VEDLAANARAAAFHDPRFAPLTRTELAATTIEVSLLSPITPMPCSREADAVARLRPGVDGVVFECAGRRATFLPRVWETLPDPWAFLEHLKLKAGFPADFWSDSVLLSRYTVIELEENRP